MNEWNEDWREAPEENLKMEIKHEDIIKSILDKEIKNRKECISLPWEVELMKENQNDN